MELKNKSKTIYISDNDDTTIINLREIIEKYAYYWKWFVLGVFITLPLAYLYLLSTPNQYDISTTIFIDDQEQGGLTTELSAFQDLGVFNDSKTSIINEIGVLKSLTLMEEVIKKLELNVTYYKQENFSDPELYGEKIPFKINFFIKDSIFYNIDTTFQIMKKSNTQFLMKTEEGNIEGEFNFGKNLKTKFGEINVTPADINSVGFDENIIIKINPLKNVVSNYRKIIEIEP